jgi:gamma-carbonic anhydrase
MGHALVRGRLRQPSLFPGARRGEGCEIRVNAVVHVNSTLEADTTVPIGWIAVGDPAELFSAA